jgi:hypothetical protein
VAVALTTARRKRPPHFRPSFVAGSAGIGLPMIAQPVVRDLIATSSKTIGMTAPSRRVRRPQNPRYAASRTSCQPLLTLVTQ